jgi:protein-L-isoaspartate(D-aspartate) O-methyltransferase
MKKQTTTSHQISKLNAILIHVSLLCLSFGCGGKQSGATATESSKTESSSTEAARAEMVRTTIEARGVKDSRVLDAMRAEPREEYMPKEKHEFAYDDAAVQIGWGQTISRPYIVGLMTSLLKIEPTSRVLEIGTGSGYQAAILDRLAGQVFSIEIVEPLCKQAAESLKRMGHGRVQGRCGDGYVGWPEEAPFDRVILTAAPPEIPQALIDQLKPGGRLVAPVGGKSQVQELEVIDKLADGTIKRENYRDVHFVPMVHAADPNEAAPAATSDQSTNSK